jgi:hypothetical protein
VVYSQQWYIRFFGMVVGVAESATKLEGFQVGKEHDVDVLMLVLGPYR